MVKPHRFKEGDMVLKKILPNIKDQRGKWAPNYEGPYVVKHAFSSGALILTDAEGRDLKYPVNAYSVKISIEATTEASAPSQNRGKARAIRHAISITNFGIRPTYFHFRCPLHHRKWSKERENYGGNQLVDPNKVLEVMVRLKSHPFITANEAEFISANKARFRETALVELSKLNRGDLTKLGSKSKDLAKFTSARIVVSTETDSVSARLGLAA
ncbi:hypothetical protein CR513_50524, partial [Mucuna pruriens]